ncbi:MAG: sodium:solute symporter family protein [Calditrichae bacterium]|nr:sodium:solute symporter family protein [Calditrichia bacterium]
MTITDIIVFLAYIIILLFVGWRSKQRDDSHEEYLLSSRTLSLPALVATLVTTWYGGILGVGEFIYTNGISAWVIFGVPYYFFAVLFAFFIAPKIRTAKYLSIPDLLYQNYGKSAGLLGSFFILFITSPAPYILITGILISYLFGLNLTLSVITAALFSIIYIFKGGFRSVVQTDKFQFMLMFGGFAILLIYLYMDFGSPVNAFNSLTENQKSLTGGLKFQEIIVWFLIASWTFIDPGFHQRTAAAKSPKVAKNAILVSVLFWFIFDMMTLSTGIYATSILPDSDPLMIYPLIAEKVLPPLLKSLFIITLMAIVMSTIDSFSFLSAQTFGRDIIAYWNKKDSDLEIKHYTRIGLFITAVISLLLIWWMPSVVKLWYNLGSLFIPPLLIPVLYALYGSKKIHSKNIIQLMLGSFLVSLMWYSSGFFLEGSYLFGVEPFIPGLLFSVALFIYSLSEVTVKK